jgi:hypothetical protein
MVLNSYQHHTCCRVDNHSHNGGPWEGYHRLSTMLTITDQYIMSDVICAWRAVVLWNKDKRVIAILLLLILGTMGVSWSILSFPIGVD